ncbi:HlyD family type I secretion periplasmic adaptor subunit [Echinimonas agarilytica]|uniref:Membrane fusion protein (MFP) family protein n=1 Tax=Echinimonas agarilytica TaxID=1215918 RepID=A0AA42B8C4_9GAMM|nr:HlyD family type I secretion periplasmic adaptor subunit [Echinimonas agarilytica]MCM2680333.1 HlyD family type I secretion periplasmic adaptor subunit [Echinimonas agarilytica]
MKQQPTDQELSLMSDRSAAMLLNTPKGARTMLWSIGIFLVLALMWAAFAEIDEVAVGSGKVIPSQQMQVIQNLEGGIVAEIFIKEGQAVEVGTPLIRLDDTLLNSEFRERNRSYDDHRVIIARLKDEIASVDTFANSVSEEEQTVIVSDAFLSEFDEELPTLTKRERRVLRGRINGLTSAMEVLEQQREQAENDLSALQGKLVSVTRSYHLAEQEIELMRPLVEEGVVSQIEFLQKLREENNLKGEMNAARLAIPKARNTIEETLEKREEVAAKFRSESLRDLSRFESESGKIVESRVGLEDKVNRTLVRSPVNGTIQKLNINTVGGVVQPGMNLVEIVPIDGKLLVEAKIKPEDIAFIRNDLSAVVKFTAYDFAIYGGINGKVVNVSPDTVLDEEGNSFYLVRVETEKSYLGNEQAPLPIITGMLTSVDIMTGKKSVLDYLLKPITRARANALRER